MSISQVSAQSNFMIGYKLGYLQSETIDAIYKQYNGIHGLEDPLPDLRYLNGLTFGYRLTLGPVATELSWSNMGGNQKAAGVSDLTGEVLQKRIGWSINQYDAALYLGNRWFSAGGGVGYRRIRTETDIAGLKETDRDLLTQSEWVALGQVNFEMKAKNVALAIQPYVTYPLKSTDVTALHTELIGAEPTQAVEEDFLMFGVRVAIYNGPQR